MLIAVRLAWRLQRFEIAFVAAACLALTAAAAFLTLDMRSILDACGTPDATRFCESMYPLQNTHAGIVPLVQFLVAFVPFVAGLVLGVPIVTREIEGRTALVAWPLAGSRVRWLWWRLWPVALIGTGLTVILAMAADQMARTYSANFDIGFLGYDARGPQLVMRSAVMLAVGLVIGAVIGRLLPSLLIGIGLAIAVWAGLVVALPRWVPSVELIEDPEMFEPGALATDTAYRMPDGRVVSFEEGALAEEALTDGGEMPDPDELPRTIRYGIAAGRYPDVLVREAAALGTATLGLVGLAAIAVQRRRPS